VCCDQASGWRHSSVRVLMLFEANQNSKSMLATALGYMVG
jgi:hypothetical protein